MRRVSSWVRAKWRRRSTPNGRAPSRVLPPRYASIPLCQAPGAVCSGGAFVLRDAARQSDVVTINGWQAEVRERERVVLVRGGSEGNYDDAFRSALMHSQKALDLMSACGSNDLVIKGFDEDHLVWWTEPGGLVVRVVALSTLSVDIPSVELTVTDASGNVVPSSAPPPLAWHESFRYFRLSQITEDLFDAYRNAYLALEAVLSGIAPQRTDAKGRVIEGEGAWFRRALTAANTLVPLAPFAPPGSTHPVQDIFDELYLQMRSPMSHSKTGRKVLLPQNEAERQTVTASLRRLVDLYLRLAESHLAARRLGGMVTTAGFRGMVSPILGKAIVNVSEDESPFDASDTTPNPAGGRLVPLAPTGGLDTSAPFVATRLWSAPVTALTKLPFVRRVVAVSSPMRPASSTSSRAGSNLGLPAASRSWWVSRA
jgi:hypothetical protein